MAQGKPQLKFERNPRNNFRDNRCHTPTDDGRTTDEFRFHELCWHSQADRAKNQCLMSQVNHLTQLLVSQGRTVCSWGFDWSFQMLCTVANLGHVACFKKYVCLKITGSRDPRWGVEMVLFRSSRDSMSKICTISISMSRSRHSSRDTMTSMDLGALLDTCSWYDKMAMFCSLV